MIHLILLALLIGSIIHITVALEKENKGGPAFDGLRLARSRLVFWILLILNCISFWVWLIRMAVE